MKTKSATKEPATIKMPENFERFAKALMAVPKKELDKQMEKHDKQRHKQQHRKQKATR
jgi:hypothetical protein